jgi:hypothetical protein
MRKLLALVMVVLLGAALLAVAGCGGGDTKTAQEYLKTADAAYAAWQNSITQLTNSLTATLGGAMTGNYSAVTPEALNNANAMITKAINDLAPIKADYQKVDSLKGVDDYKAYADAMVKAIDANENALKQGQQLIQSLIPLAGDSAAMAAWFTANSNTLTQLQDANNATTKLYNDAQQIKTDKNLSW